MRLAWSTFDRPKASRADLKHLSNEPSRSWGPEAGRERKSCRRFPAQPAWHRSTRRKPCVDNCQHSATMVCEKAAGPYLVQGLLQPWANYAYRARGCLRAALEPFPHGQEAAPESGDLRRRGLCQSAGLGYRSRWCTRLGYFAMPSWTAGWLQRFRVVDPARLVSARASDSAGGRPTPPLNFGVI